MTDFPWLTASLLVPLVGAVVVAVLPARPDGGDLHKKVALGFSLLTLVLVAVVGLGFDIGGDRYQFVENHEWIKSFGAHYALGVDGIGLTLVLLTAILTPVVILASWNDGDGGRWGVGSFFAWMLALEGLALGVFAAMDVFLFYVLFEATLIPIYFLIGGFGGARRTYAAMKFQLLSLHGGLLILASFVG
ncbi:MAG: proton-conducting transporter transmembrane domain-containing protein, partial [Nocardioides sp.]